MTEILGWLAAAIGVSSSIPQVVRILRSGTSSGVSMRLWQLTAATAVAWTVHGVFVGSAQMQVPNLLNAIFAVGILVFVLRNRGQMALSHFLIPVALAAALIGIDVWLGAMAYGIVVAVPQVVGQLAQLRSLLRTPDPAGVSALFLGVFALGQLLWLVYGIAFGDLALIICAAAMVVVAVLNLVVCMVRQARARVVLAV